MYLYTQDDAPLYDQKLVKDLIYPFLRKELILPSQEKRFKFSSVMITIHFTKGDPHILLIKRTKLIKITPVRYLFQEEILRKWTSICFKLR